MASVAAATAEPDAPDDPSEDHAPVDGVSGLGVASLVLGAIAVVLGVTLVWFFLALPLGLAAIVCALVERRTTRRRDGRPAGGIVTAGLVLGAVAVPLSFGGLLVIPQLEGAVEHTIGLTQRDVSEDLDSVERSFSDSVDDLDTTLSENVDQSAAALKSDFEGLESSSQKELREVEDRVGGIIAELERTSGADLDEVEQAVRSDLTELEAAIRDDIAAVNGRVAAAEERARAELDALDDRVRSLEGGSPSVVAGS